MPLSTEPCDRAIVSTMPNVARAKYSGAPNAVASCSTAGDRVASASVAMQPAVNEPIAEMASAAPARPCFAIWWPSIAVTAEDGSPGRFTRIAVIEPPYWAP